MQKFKTVEELINQLKPNEPVYCIRKKSIQLASKFFLNKFPGNVLYAVKTNPHPLVLKTIVARAILYPKLIPKNNTTKVCIVIGTGSNGILIFAEIAKIIEPKKMIINDLIILDWVFCFISSIKNNTLIFIFNLY